MTRRRAMYHNRGRGPEHDSGGGRFGPQGQTDRGNHEHNPRLGAGPYVTIGEAMDKAADWLGYDQSPAGIACEKDLRDASLMLRDRWPKIWATEL
jgi:hypothetical protein